MKWRAELVLFIRSLLIVSITLNYFSSSVGIIALANGEVLSESTILKELSQSDSNAIEDIVDQEVDMAEESIDNIGEESEGNLDHKEESMDNIEEESEENLDHKEESSINNIETESDSVDNLLAEDVSIDGSVDQEKSSDITGEESSSDVDLSLLKSSEARKIGSGLVQLWQVVPEGQQHTEGATTSAIMNALKCKPNHDLYPISDDSAHTTYVNSCYVDDALYLGEDQNYYYIYISGYEGKVAKSKSHYYSLDLNNDGEKVKYEIQTVAYFIPDNGQKSIINQVNEDAKLLEYTTDYLDKYNENSTITFSDWSVQSPSYYTNENGTLVHYLSNNVRSTNNYSKSIIGKAPSWMKSNTQYFSYDGIYFYNRWQDIRVNGVGAVNQTNPFYNYYQYLPFRSKTNYSADSINSYTNSNVGGSNSKLLGTGSYFYNVQDLYGINGALQYAMGIHESGWGKSTLSLNKNNLFGMNATDDNPYGNGTSFPNVESGINYHADRYISWGYTDPIDDYRYYGSHVGNKGSGMNVKYASDPFWGEKIAGWYYRFDQASGMKDYNYYSIGIKQNASVYNVRLDSSSTSKILYKTQNPNMSGGIKNYPVILLDEVNGHYKIQSDTPIVNGNAVYNAQYIYSKSQVYVSTEAITAFSGKEFKIFDDVKPSDWFAPFVSEFYNKEYIVGYGDGTFRPNNAITRIEFVKLVNKTFGFTQKANISFTDLKEDWHKEMVAIGVKAGYLATGYHKFRPHDKITRQEAAKIIGVILSIQGDGKMNFKDQDEISDYAYLYVDGLTEAGVFVDYAYFRPHSSLTRAEALKILSLAEKIEK